MKSFLKALCIHFMYHSKKDFVTLKQFSLKLRIEIKEEFNDNDNQKKLSTYKLIRTNLNRIKFIP